MAEHPAVNRRVVGSSPTRGAPTEAKQRFGDRAAGSWLSQREAAMDDRQWIQHLQNGMKSAGWTPVGPDQTEEGWIAGAVRFQAGGTGASGPTGFGKTPTRAVEDTYRQVIGDLPHRP